MTFSYIFSEYLKIIINAECLQYLLSYLNCHSSQTKKQNMVMETYKELLGTCIKSKKIAYINGVCTKSTSKDSLNCFTIFGSSACQGQHVFSMSFLTCTAPCTDWSRDFIRSRAPYSIYTKQVIPIRSRTFRVGHPATRSRAFGVGHPAIRSRAFEVGHPAIQTRAFGVGYSK